MRKFFSNHIYTILGLVVGTFQLCVIINAPNLYMQIIDCFCFMVSLTFFIKGLIEKEKMSTFTKTIESLEEESRATLRSVNHVMAAVQRDIQELDASNFMHSHRYNTTLN